MTFWLTTSPDALPLSYRRLVGAKAIKLGSCDKRPAYCLDIFHFSQPLISMSYLHVQHCADRRHGLMTNFSRK